MPTSQPKTTDLREHARELITAAADSGLEVYYEMLRKARAERNDAMVHHWTRRIEERRRFLARLK